MTTVDRHPKIQSSHARSGLTLIEIMIALTMTLIVLGAMMQAFKFASDEMAKGRAVMEVANQLRSTEEILRRDLNGLTVDPRPYTGATVPSGYFEYIEGPRHDNTGSVDDRNTLVDERVLYSYLGDVDDILAMTVRSEGRPFRGRFNGTVIESSLAEVVWFTFHNDRNGDDIIDFDEAVTLYRRVMLIRPDLDLSSYIADDEFFAENDISARIEGGGLVSNSLIDLAYRGNRFCHFPFAFPHVLQRANSDASLPDLGNVRASDPVLTFPSYTGDDIVLNEICAFDIKVFSRNAAVNVIPGTNRIREQSDVNFQISIDGLSNLGGFVDLGALPGNRGTQGDFSEQPATKSQLGGNNTDSVQVYDTWTPQYEYDAIDQDNLYGIDQATNDFDDDDQNGVDDNGERETMPPYPKPIRGLKITLRVIEKNSKQIRQSSIIQSFMPQ